MWDQDLCLLQEQEESEKENSCNQKRGTTGKAGGDKKLQKDLAVATWHTGRTHLQNAVRTYLCMFLFARQPF